MTRFLVAMGLFVGIGLGQRMPGFDLGALDRTVDPCVNFYKFSCGGWQKANPLPGDQSRFGRFNQLQDNNLTVLQNILETASSNKPGRSANEQKIGDFYFSCMDEKTVNAKGVAPIKADLDRISALKDKKGLPDLLASLYKTGVQPFFSFYSEQDAKDATQMIAGLDQPGLSMPDRDYYLKDDAKSAELRSKYVDHIAKMMELAGERPEVAKKHAQTVLAMEIAMAKDNFDRVTRRDPEKVYHKLSMAELISLAPEFDWARFFKATGSPAFTSLDVNVPPAVRGFHALSKDYSIDDLKTYMTWALLHNNASLLSSAFVDENFNFFRKTLTGQKENRPRWKRCVQLTDDLLPDALGKTFVDKTLGADGVKRTQDMVTAIEKALERDIQTLEWMTPATKQQALEKLHSISNKIGNKAKWLDYANIRVVRGDVLGSANRATEFEVARQLAKIGKPIDPTEWSMSQPTVNAYYDPQMNNVNFPAGILQPPFWDKVLDDAVNFGAIGAVIGHEITHGFDDQGRQFDAKGNLRDWWTAEDAKAFEQRAGCIVDQYSGYSPTPGVNLNGKLTLGENTADNGGVRIAFMALQETMAAKGADAKKPIDGFTPEQRFFLGFAQVWCENTATAELERRAVIDPHSPGEFRVNGVVSNSADFRQAFSCREGQPMVRAQSCRVW